MLAPVIIFVYNRPEHTKKTVEALANNFLAKETEVFIYSDSTKNDSNIELVNETRNYIDTLPNLNYFKNIKIIKAEKNKGLANSIIGGVSEIIDKFGKVIVVEDDLISSNDFLRYMNTALDFYKRNKSIWSISGFNIPIEIPNNYNHDVYLSYRACSWGWATWKDRWAKVDWDVSDYCGFKNDKKLREKMNRGGRDMANMLDAQMEGKIDSWAIRWCYSQSKLDMVTVYPVKSRIKNIGLDGTGTHSGTSSRYDFEVSQDNGICNFENVELNKLIVKRFQEHYMKLHDYYIFRFKKMVKKLIGR
ncbi:glycosyltransferase [Clostridia bacterium]|nr:glycosyltransferase [Clostridia bacterium]